MQHVLLETVGALAVLASIVAKIRFALSDEVAIATKSSAPAVRQYPLGEQD